MLMTLVSQKQSVTANLTKNRYRFFCTKPTSPQESHDHWITRLRTKGKDCEFENMNLDEAIKLVVTLHTPSEKLQREIIAKDILKNGHRQCSSPRTDTTRSTLYEKHVDGSSCTRDQQRVRKTVRVKGSNHSTVSNRHQGTTSTKPINR